MNTVYFFTVDRMTVADIGVTFSPNNVLKHSNQERNWTVATIGRTTTKSYTL